MYREYGGPDKNGHFRRNIFIEQGDYDTYRKFIEKQKNCGAYHSAFWYDKDMLYGDPYLDFDAKNFKIEYPLLVREVRFTMNYLSTIMGIGKEQFRLYFSGHKGFHLIIPSEYCRPNFSPSLNEEFKLFMEGVSYMINGKRVGENYLDSRIYDNRRLFRIPYTINEKSGLRKIPLVYSQLGEGADSILSLSKQDIAPLKYPPIEYDKIKRSAEGYRLIVEVGNDYEALKKGKKRAHSEFVKHGKKSIFPCTKQLMEQGIESGARNNSAFTLASSLLQLGESPEEMFSHMEEWNEMCSPPLSTRELLITCQSAQRSFDEGKRVGCGRYIELGFCVDSCPLRG